jgi:hypothetical protein
MTKQQITIILIGLGTGLVGALAFICFPEIFFFILFWRHGFLLLVALFLLLITGYIFSSRSKRHVKSLDSN